MGKLTKKQRDELRSIMRHAERALSYIMRQETVICKQRTIGASKSGVPYPPPHSGWQSEMSPGLELIGPIEKRAGSDLVGLHDAVVQLSMFLLKN